MNEIVDKQPEGIRIHLMYDIACNRVRHLKVEMHVHLQDHARASTYTTQIQVNGNQELLKRVEFAIPAFHTFCHIPSCQVSVHAIYQAAQLVVVIHCPLSCMKGTLQPTEM